GDAHTSGEGHGTTTTQEATTQPAQKDHATDHAIHDDQDFEENKDRHVTSTPANNSVQGTAVTDSAHTMAAGQDVHDDVAHTQIGQDHAAETVKGGHAE